jgi:dephospho-CoA kinase
MKCIFITGMSGTGKSSVMEELQSRGFVAIDTDYDDWCELSLLDGEPEWLWREERMRALLAVPRTSPLFVSGCCDNQRKFYSYFDYKILFSAPLEVMLQRVSQRTSNPYGKTAAQQTEIRWNYEHIQPLLKQSADFELDSAQMSVNEMADFLAKLALNDSM